MHGFEFLDELVLLFLVAVAVIIVFNRFKLPPIIGLIATGLLVGPSGLALVAQDDVISAVSELGVILLLFTIGLEFSFDDLKRLRKVVLIGGPLQIIASTVVIGLSAYAVAQWTEGGLSVNAALLMGMAMALSSTAICIKMLKDRRELGLPHGRAVLGILIFQDIAVVPMMIIVTLMAPNSTLTAMDIVVRLGMLVGVTAALMIGLRYILPKLIPYVTRVSTPEVLILGGLAICFGTAWITSAAGISMALGAFIAGVAIGGSEEGHAFGRVLHPMRDAFTSMFFLSIGLLVEVTWAWMPVNIITALGILVVNTLVVILILASLRINLRTAVMSGIILAQVGEFSFVLATAGHEYGILTDFNMQNMIVSIIITMIVTPTLITFAPWFAERAAPVVRYILPIQRWYDRRVQRDPGLPPLVGGISGPVVTIIGGGVLGTNVGRVLGRTAIPYCILELNGANVARLRESGCTVVQGDMTDHEALERAGILHASVIIIAISDHTALAQGLDHIRKLRPDAMIVVRTRYARDSDVLLNRGADVIITEEYESSIQVFVTVLEHLGVDPDVIIEHEDAMRDSRYGLLARLGSVKNDDGQRS
jgi:monovalent cation:H+ antiporter-2, CPA2 family